MTKAVIACYAICLYLNTYHLCSFYVKGFSLSNKVVPFRYSSSIYLLRTTDTSNSDAAHKIDSEFSICDVGILDFYNIFALSVNEFLPTQDSFIDKYKLIYRIFELFLPKLLIPSVMQHTLYGAKTRSGELVGFIDFSLQASTGTTLALEPLTYQERFAQYGDLKPYICNLLIAPKYRTKGLGRRLLHVCEMKAASMGFHEIFLHADTTTTPAIRLYITSNYDPIKRINNIVFMRKDLSYLFPTKSNSTNMNNGNDCV